MAAPITTISPAGGSYTTGSILATLSCSSSSAAIYYTTDGSVPTEQSAVYSAPIAVTGNKIGGSVYWWNGMTYDSWTILGNNPRIEPWKGYWIVNLDSVEHQLTITDTSPAAE